MIYNYCHVSIIIDLMEISYPRSRVDPRLKIRSSRGRLERPRVIDTPTPSFAWVDRIGWTMILRTVDEGRRNYEEERVSANSAHGWNGSSRRARPPLRLMRFLCRVSFRSKATISALDAHSSIEEASLERNDLWERSALSRRGW